MKILREIKNSPFKPLTKKWYFGRVAYGTPYFYPRGFNSNIISFRKLELTPQEELDKLSNDWQRISKKYKNMPMVRRNWDRVFEFMGNDYWISLGWPIAYRNVEMGWKDKFHSPRLEWQPSRCFYFFKWQVCLFYVAPNGSRNADTYWEMFLWWKYYSNEDLEKAESTWGWVDSTTRKSTWDKSVLKKC
jgi:hypothetical protein